LAVDFVSPEICPNCGADVPRNAKACSECGADEKTGWSDSAYADNLGISGEDFDYENFLKEEFDRENKPRGISWLWWVTALGLVLLFMLFYFR
jgi:uncharacterized membrane protein YvbJ